MAAELEYRTTDLTVDKLHAEDVRQEEQDLVLRVVLLRCRDVGIHAIDLLDLASGRALPADTCRRRSSSVSVKRKSHSPCTQSLQKLMIVEEMMGWKTQEARRGRLRISEDEGHLL